MNYVGKHLLSEKNKGSAVIFQLTYLGQYKDVGG